ncbi:MAG: hypothetical protein U0002_15455 [Thermoanaerobaculia bacterium]
MTRLATIAGLLLLGLSAQIASAEIGTIDAVPAATLLVPYFEINLDPTDWTATLFSINNAAAEPAIAHVTLWTDLSVPTLDFNVFLTGYDVVTFNLRDLFTTGRLPQTSHVNTTISPRGIYSNTTNPVTGVGPGSTSCNDQLPLPALPALLLDHIRAAHTGQASPVIFGGLCSGVDHGDNVARGYITIDNVNFCSLQFPGETGYWISGGLGVGNNQNVLWGDMFYVNETENSAQGMTLVHVEASDDLGPADYTFYRRYSGGSDQREGLGNLFAARFLNGGAFDGGTDLVVWRDSKRSISPFSCALEAPNPFPLSANQIVVFDEAENPEVPPTSPFSPPIPGDLLIPFPWEANLTHVGGENFPVSFNFGWVYLNLDNNVAGSQVPFEPLLQNWVQVIHSANGRFSVGYDGIQLGNVTDPATAPDTLLPVCDGAPDPPGCS